jgi:glycosyltransferase involved in cell wall biosynthesis
MRKRLDWAVDLLGLLRAEDERFTLYVKGRLPLEYPWVWRRSAERDHFLGLADKIAGDPLLAESVIFDGFGSDVAEWLGKVGFILSPSDFESYHLGLAEGIGSGAVPIIRDWDGAAEIYPGERLVHTPAEAAQIALEAVIAGELDRRERAALQAVPDTQVIDVCRAWERLLLAPACDAILP